MVGHKTYLPDTDTTHIHTYTHTHTHSHSLALTLTATQLQLPAVGWMTRWVETAAQGAATTGDRESEAGAGGRGRQTVE